LLAADPINGAAHIANLIWTHILANTLVGTDISGNLSVAAYEPSLVYDLKYAIPAFLSLALWLPVFLGALVILLTKSLKFSHMRNLLNHTSVGRVVMGDSALTVANCRKETRSGKRLPETEDWAREIGGTFVIFRPPGTYVRMGGSSSERAEVSPDGDGPAVEENRLGTSSLNNDAVDEAYRRGA